MLCPFLKLIVEFPQNVDAGKRILEVGDTTAAKRQKVSSGKYASIF